MTVLVKARNQVIYEQKETTDIIGWVAFIKIYVLVWRGVCSGVLLSHNQRCFMEGDMKCTVEQHVHLNFYTSKRNVEKGVQSD